MRRSATNHSTIFKTRQLKNLNSNYKDIFTQKQHFKRKAFALIELLVVIVIIAILAAILLPVLARATVNARRASGLSNLKQIELGLSQYLQDYDSRFPNTVTEQQGVSYYGATDSAAGVVEYSIRARLQP